MTDRKQKAKALVLYSSSSDDDTTTDDSDTDEEEEEEEKEEEEEEEEEEKEEKEEEEKKKDVDEYKLTDDIVEYIQTHASNPAQYMSLALDITSTDIQGKVFRDVIRDSTDEEEEEENTYESL